MLRTGEVMEPTTPAPAEKWWRRRPMQASGIVRVRTNFLRRLGREPDRKKLFRPPLLVNLLLLVVAVLGGAGALAHRRSLDDRLDALLAQDAAAPFEIKKIRRDLAELETDEKTLSKELDTRLKYARAQRVQEFYLVLDRATRRFAFKFADRVVRDGCFDIGAPDRISDRHGATWTFAPVTGAFSVQEKLEHADWQPPAWVYAMNREKAPANPPVVPDGLGRYVLQFSGGYIIHSPPAAGSPLTAAKPGSFMFSEQDLGAIWRRVNPGTRVYIF
jgi:hypothetical protein